MKIHLRRLPIPRNLLPEDITGLHFLHSTEEHVLRLEQNRLVLYLDAAAKHAAFTIILDRGGFLDHLQTVARIIASMSVIKELHLDGVDNSGKYNYFPHLEFIWINDADYRQSLLGLSNGLGNLI